MEFLYSWYIFFLQHLLLLTALRAQNVSAALKAPCSCVTQDCGDKCLWWLRQTVPHCVSPNCISLGAPIWLWNIGALLWASHCSSLLYGEPEIALPAWRSFGLGSEQNAKDFLLGFLFFPSKSIQTAGAKSIPPSNLNNGNDFSSCSGNQLLSSSQEGLPLPSGQDMALSMKIDI